MVALSGLYGPLASTGTFPSVPGWTEFRLFAARSTRSSHVIKGTKKVVPFDAADQQPSRHPWKRRAWAGYQRWDGRHSSNLNRFSLQINVIGSGEMRGFLSDKRRPSRARLIMTVRGRRDGWRDGCVKEKGRGR